MTSVSKAINRYQRLFDISSTLIRRRDQLDVVILETYSGRSFVADDIASAIAQRLRKPIVFHLHGGGLPAFMARHPHWTRRVFDRGQAFVAPSHYLQRAIAAQGYNVELIPNTIEPRAYRFRHRRDLRPRLFWMRGFHAIYNPTMAVDVLARVRRLHPEATLIMAGQDKGLEATTRQHARSLGVAEAVTFVGFLDPLDKVRVAHEADIFITTSRVDNTPVSVIEAWALGLPVVATNVGGVSDLVTDGETGLLVGDGEADAMAAAVDRLLRDVPLVERLTLRGREAAKEATWERAGPRWAELLARVTCGSVLA